MAIDLSKIDFEKLTPAEILSHIKEIKKEMAKIHSSEDKADQARYKQLKKFISGAEEYLKITNDTKDLTMEIMKLEQEAAHHMKSGADAAKEMVNNVASAIEQIPVLGKFITGLVDFDMIGDAVKKNVLEMFGKVKPTLFAAQPAAWALNAALTAGIGAVIGILLGLIMYFQKAKALSKDMGIGLKDAAKLSWEIDKAQAQLIGRGLDATEIAGEMLDTFGTLSSISDEAIVSIGKLQTKYGATSKDIIQLQKSLTDLFGITVDQSTVVVDNIGALAESQGVAAGKVIADMASNSSKFAEFATDGAMGMAQAAIEAAKVGANLGTVLGFAESLLDFETSLTAQFEAQVLTGKNLNLEKARQLALEGNMLGLTQELQKTVGSLGEIQSMNVIERQMIAKAIGISADDLLKVARGEQIAERETVQSKLDITNQLLASGNEEREMILNEQKKDKFSGITY